MLVTLILNTLIKGSGSSVVQSLNTPPSPPPLALQLVVTLLLSPLEILKICLNLPDKIDHGRTGEIFRLPETVKILVF